MRPSTAGRIPAKVDRTSGGVEGLDAARMEARLRRPLVPREEGVFRLGLALNGTASTAAWTAGALDFLVEALDLWEQGSRMSRVVR